MESVNIAIGSINDFGFVPWGYATLTIMALSVVMMIAAFVMPFTSSGKRLRGLSIALGVISGLSLAFSGSMVSITQSKMEVSEFREALVTNGYRVVNSAQLDNQEEYNERFGEFGGYFNLGIKKGEDTLTCSGTVSKYSIYGGALESESRVPGGIFSELFGIDDENVWVMTCVSLVEAVSEDVPEPPEEDNVEEPVEGLPQNQVGEESGEESPDSVPPVSEDSPQEENNESVVEDHTQEQEVGQGDESGRQNDESPEDNQEPAEPAENNVEQDAIESVDLISVGM